MLSDRVLRFELWSRDSQVMGTPPGRNLFENGSRNGKIERAILEGSQLAVSDPFRSTFRGQSRSQVQQGMQPSGQTRAVPSVDTLQLVLPLLLEHLDPESAVLCYQTASPWRKELEARGFCLKTVQLCAALAEDADFTRLDINVLMYQNKSSSQAGRNMCLDARIFLDISRGMGMIEGSLHKWLQAASQQPDASFFARGAASTARSLALPLLHWGGKPQSNPTRLCTLPGHASYLRSVAISPDGKRFASGSDDGIVKIWDTTTGEEVSSLLLLRDHPGDNIRANGTSQKWTPPEKFSENAT